MPVAQARSIFPAGSGDPGSDVLPAIRVLPHEPERDLMVLRALAVWANRFAPNVAIDEPDGLLLDVSGCARTFGGETRLLEQLLGGLERLGFRARGAIAPTFGCAWAAARYGEERATVVADDGARDAIAHLPVESLRLTDEALAGLAEVGIERVEHVLGLPRSVLPARFGGELLWRLDQALGHAMEVIEAVRDPAPVRAERVFDGPTTQWEAIEVTVRDLLERVCAELRSRESGAQRLDVELERSDLAPARLAITLSRPSRDARRLWSLCRPRLERTHLGFGVERIAIGAPRTARLRHEQVEFAERQARGLSHWEGPTAGKGLGSGQAEDLSHLVDTLANRLRWERVRRAELVESHVPERAFRMRSMQEGGEKRGKSAIGRVTEGDRPTVLLERALPVDVMALTPDGPVLRLWLGEREREVVATVGPERVAREWWRGGEGTEAQRHRGTKGEREMTRDYFKVQEAGGRWLWVYREVETGRWFVHGVWG